MSDVEKFLHTLFTVPPKESDMDESPKRQPLERLGTAVAALITTVIGAVVLVGGVVAIVEILRATAL